MADHGTPLFLNFTDVETTKEASYGRPTDLHCAHISEDGDIDYQLSGDAVFLVVDERAPHDRVYQMTLTMRSQR